jgi:surface protein
MIHPEFAREVMATAESDGTALMPRIADLAADSKGAPVADALLKRLSASIRNATVKGAPMYGPADLLEPHITELMKRLNQNERFQKPPSPTGLFDPALQNFVTSFLMLSTNERLDHMKTYGPMCLWDTSDVTIFFCVCEAKPSPAEPDTCLTFNSDLFWNTSAATTMTMMFHKNTEFRGDLSTWDVSKVQNMASTFNKAGIEDSGIGGWDVQSLEDATRMFENAILLSPNLDFSLWNMQNCKNLSFMFSESKIEDNNIGEWKLHRDANTTDMLRGAASFKGNLLKWEESHRNAASVPPRPSFGTKRTASSAQQSANTDIRKLFAKALSAQGREQGKKKMEKKEPQAGICAVQ